MRSLTANNPTAVVTSGRGKPAAGRGMTRPPLRKRPRSRLERFMVRGGITFGILSVLGGFGLWGAQSGWFAELGANLGETFLETTAAAGLALDEVQVSGRSETSQEDVLNAIGAKRGTPLLGIDIQATRQRLTSLPWVAAATVERRFPNKLVVQITEAEPLALWQRQQQLYLVSRDGKVIETDNLQKYAKLLVIVGDEAPQHAAKLLEMLASEPDLQRQVTAAVFVGERRWNLRLNGNVDVKLPEEDAASAWHRLAALQRQHQLLDKDITIVDLRLPNQVVVREAHPQPSDKPARKGKSNET
jgi:cell division protein FtsQ